MWILSLQLLCWTLNGYDLKHPSDQCQHFSYTATTREVLQLPSWKRRAQGTCCLLLFSLEHSSYYLICLSFCPYCSDLARSHQCYSCSSRETERALGSFYHLYYCVSKIRGGLFDTANASTSTRPFSALHHLSLCCFFQSTERMYYAKAPWNRLRWADIEKLFSKANFHILKNDKFSLDVVTHGLGRDGIFLPV